MSWIYLALRKNQPIYSVRQSGFGLIELMISISIMVIVSGIIMSRQSAFNSSILLRSQAYEIALQIRDVQLSAVSANNNSSSVEAETFRTTLGVHFYEDANLNQRYQFFRDTDSGIYDNNYYDFVDIVVDERFGIQGSLDERFEIRDIVLVGAPPGETLTGSEVSIVFERPNFDAKFYDNGPDNNGQVIATGIEILVGRVGTSGTGPEDLRTIEVTATGQIGVR